MKMVYRNDDGEIRLDYLKFLPLVDEMFRECKNREELIWLKNEMIEVLDGISFEFYEQIYCG